MSKKSLYVGRGGQMAVMAEFLMRGYNVAIPEVDTGDDIFVVREGLIEHSRIQVKTAVTSPLRQGYSARYTVKLSQLVDMASYGTWYVFANWAVDRWASFLIISRENLYRLYDHHNIGSVNKNGLLSLYFSYTDKSATCSEQDFTPYLNNWRDWPQIDP